MWFLFGWLPVRACAIAILVGLVVAVLLAERRLRARGGAPGAIPDIALWAVPFGIVGGRLYHVVTDPEFYFAPGQNPWNAFAIWDGGLGAVALRALGAWIDCLRTLPVRLVFGDVPGPEVRRVSQEIQQTWVRFTTTGDPGWAAHHPDQRLTRALDAYSRTIPTRREIAPGLEEPHPTPLRPRDLLDAEREHFPFNPVASNDHLRYTWVVTSNEIVLRQMRPDEFTDAHKFLCDLFFETSHEDDRELELLLLDLNRSILLVDGEDIVGTSASYGREMTMPGGAAVPTAAVTWVGISPTHRRRGLLTRMMRHQLDGLHADGGEAVAALWASESAIYGRFGYGMAIRYGRVEAELRDIPVRPDLRRAGGRFRQLAPETALPDMKTVYEQARPGRTGFLGRAGDWWTYRVRDPEHSRDGFGAKRVAVYHRNAQPEAYAIYRIKQKASAVGSDSVLEISELIGTTGPAEVAIWEFVTSLDLLRRVEWYNAPLDLPIRHAVAEPRRMTDQTGDSIWIRLVDVDRALTARTYSATVDVVFDVTDTFCPWNAGVWRLRAEPGKPASFERTNAPADLSLSTTELGAAYLGGTSLATLAAASRVTEHRAGALREASIAFLEHRPPYCNDNF